MYLANKKNLLVAVVTVALLVTSTSAWAFRCGRKIVKENMHEIEVIRACGQPTTSRHLGYALRGTYIPIKSGVGPGVSVNRYPGYGHFVEEVQVTEYVYNFGPRKFMRRLVFEGGILARIETLGYGFND